MIVLGTQFGDEGKGLTTSFLCSRTKNPIVVRFNGGHQAGHTVVYNGKRHVFSTFGSGTLQDIPTYWSKYCTFNPVAIVNEYNVLKNNFPHIAPVLYVNPLCPITTPYDIEYNRVIEKTNQHGSVGVGFGATLQRQMDGYNLFVRDLFHEKILVQKLAAIRNYYSKKTGPGVRHSFYHFSDFMQAVTEVKEIIHISGNEIMTRYTPIFEGAQGILLDQDFGFFPNVTRSNTTSKNAIALINERNASQNPIDLQYQPEIFYITRTYQTRHGNGFMTNEGKPIELINNENETNKPDEFQGDFRVAPLDPDLLNYAFDCDMHFSKALRKNLVITCTDQLQIDIDGLLQKLNIQFNKVYISIGDSLECISEYTIKQRQNEVVGSL